MLGVAFRAHRQGREFDAVFRDQRRCHWQAAQVRLSSQLGSIMQNLLSKCFSVCLASQLVIGGTANAQPHPECSAFQTAGFNLNVSGGTWQVYVGPPPHRYRVCRQRGEQNPFDVNVDGQIYAVPLGPISPAQAGCIDVTGANIKIVAGRSGAYGFYCAI